MPGVTAQHVADFVYLRGGVLVVEDVKGMRTPAYRQKRRWLLADYGIEVFET